MTTRRFATILFLMIISLVSTQNLMAADSADQILERARAKGQEIEKLKKVLVEDPDQNVRLTAFDLMINNGDPSMHEVALDVGLSSADALLQAAAFREAILSLERLHILLVEGSNVSKDCQGWIAANSSSIVIKLDEKDRKNGVFSSRHDKGEVSGTLLTFINTPLKANGVMQLEDDSALSGKVTLFDFGLQKNISCLATAHFR